MTLPEIIMIGVVLSVGVPAMWKNRTATALVASWAIGQATWLLTGENLPLKIYLLTDMMVLVVIFTKPDAMNCWPYDGLRSQFIAFWKERCMWDRIVVLIFPVMWLLYVANIGDYYRWWALWALVIAQFLAAGGEAFALTIQERKVNREDAPPGDFMLGPAVNV